MPTNSNAINLFQRINVLCGYIFVLLMPFNNRFYSYLIALWAISTILQCSIQRCKLKGFLFVYAPFIFFFLIQTISLSYSSNLNHGIKVLETQASFIVLPFIVLSFREQLRTRPFNFIPEAFISGLLIYFIIAVIIFIANGSLSASIELLGEHKITNLTRHYNLGWFHNRTYLSLYYVWGVFLCFRLRDSDINRTKRYLNIIIIFIFVVFILLLASRAALLSLIIVFTNELIRLIRSNRSLFLNLGISVIGVIMIFAGLRNTRIGPTVNNLFDKESIVKEERLYLWKDSYKVWTNSPIFGAGVGDAEEELSLMHKNNINILPDRTWLNSHNQYLETMIQSGLPGLLVLISILLIPLITSIKEKNNSLLIFIILLAFNLLFESMLNRLSGILFISFWLSYLSVKKGLKTDISP